MRKLAAPLIFIVFLPLLTPGHLRVWVVSDGDKILRDAAPRAASAVWSAAGGRISLMAGRNEYVAFQLMVTAEGLTWPA